MKYIAKDPELKAFRDWKTTIQTDFDRKLAEGVSGDILWTIVPSSPPHPDTAVELEVLFDKSQLRNALLSEQGFICCYCNRALKADHTTIVEHFKPKGLVQYRSLVFDYQNLMACCDGGERDKAKPRETYCTLEKDNDDPIVPVAIISPLNTQCEDFFEFDVEGRIHPKNEDAVAETTIKFLGLNATSLKLNRKAAIDTYIYNIWTEDMDTAAELKLLSSKDEEGRFEPFCTAIIHVLKNYL